MIAPARALLLGTTDLMRPRIGSVLLLGAGLTILLLIALQAAVFALAWRFGPETLTLPLLGTLAIGHALGWSTLLLFPLLGFFLMAPVAAGFAGLFTERVAETVEQIHYPARIGTPVEIWEGLMDAFAIMLAMIGIGLVLLVVSPFIGPLAPVLFYALNGWLLGREFFHQSARRHLPAPEAEAMRRANGGRVLTLGVMIAVLLTVPLLAVVVPVLAAAAFTHLFHGLAGDIDRAA